MAIQPRTLEVLAGLGITDELLRRGNPAVRIAIHAGRRTVRVPLFDIGVGDTAYPFLLFLSQAETEAVLDEHLTRCGLAVERGRELVDLRAGTNRVVCTTVTRHGETATIEADDVVGCDGARSTVRRHAGIAFSGSAYPQTFALADLDADGLEPGAAHTYLSDSEPGPPACVASANSPSPTATAPPSATTGCRASRNGPLRASAGRGVRRSRSGRRRRSGPSRAGGVPGPSLRRRRPATRRRLRRG